MKLEAAFATLAGVTITASLVLMGGMVVVAGPAKSALRTAAPVEAMAAPAPPQALPASRFDLPEDAALRARIEAMLRANGRQADAAMARVRAVAASDSLAAVTASGERPLMLAALAEDQGASAAQ